MGKDLHIEVANTELQILASFHKSHSLGSNDDILQQKEPLTTKSSVMAKCSDWVFFNL